MKWTGYLEAGHDFFWTIGFQLPENGVRLMRKGSLPKKRPMLVTHCGGDEVMMIFDYS